MTMKTIPAYLEDERRKLGDAKLEMEAEAARIQPLHHGHDRELIKAKGAAEFPESFKKTIEVIPLP